MDKREQNKAQYLRNAGGKVKDPAKNGNAISIQIQDDPTKVNAGGPVDSGQRRQKADQHASSNQVGPGETRGRTNQLASKSPKPFAQSKFLNRQELQRANHDKLVQAYLQGKPKQAPTHSSEPYTAGFQSPPVIVGGTPEPELPYKSHPQDKKHALSVKGSDPPRSPKLAAPDRERAGRRGSGEVQQKEAQGDQVPVSGKQSVVKASQDVVSDNNAQEWLTQSSIARIEKTTAKEPPAPGTRNQPVSRSLAPTKHEPKHPRIKA